jgi:hypothetical protein
MKLLTGLLLFLLLSSVVHSASERDPMRPPAGTGELSAQVKQEQPRWILQSVLISGQRNIAVINQRTVSVGDHINGARVVAIHPGYVRLSKANEVFIIRLPSLSVKRPASGQ